ncbi:CARDB domain-containing protein [Shimia sp. MIT910701]|uniref:CARDB domain-containing protein n=1 Tax=Shimia sp. MIT910701 TaxID=3096987 RepID=UPI00399A9BF4
MSVDLRLGLYSGNQYSDLGVSNDVHRGQVRFWVTNDGTSAMPSSARYQVVAYAPDGTELMVMADANFSAISAGSSKNITAAFDHANIYTSYPELIGQALSYEVRVDVGSAIAETDETNNKMMFAGEPLPVIGPDLTFQPTYSDGYSDKGVFSDRHSAQIQFVARNDDVGTMEASAHYSIVAFAPDGTELMVVKEGVVGKLAPGQNKQIRAYFNHDQIYANHPELAGQSLTYEVRLDSGSLVSETDETNNTLTFIGDPLPVIGPDLTFQPTYSDGYSDKGVFSDRHSAQIQFVARNDDVGTMEASAHYSIVAFAPDGTELMVVKEGVVGKLDPGQNKQIRAYFNHDQIYANHPELVGQRLTYEVRLDSGSLVSETDETNNTLTFVGDPLPVIGPDLAFVDNYANGYGDRGTQGDSHIAEIRFFYANDDVGSMGYGAKYTIVAFAPDGTELLQVKEGGLSKLNPGQSAQVRAQFNHDEIYANYPELIGQSLTYEVRLDSGNIIAETDETNNTMTFVGQPLPDMPADLAVQQVSITEEGVLDGVMQASLQFDYSIVDLRAFHGAVNYQVELIAPGETVGTVFATGVIAAPVGNSSGSITIPDVAAQIYGLGQDALNETYEFRVTLDPQNTISETNENNNTGVAELYAPVILPDAYVTEARSVLQADGSESFVFKASLGGNDVLSGPVDYQIVASAENGGPVLVLETGNTTLFAGGDTQVIQLDDLSEALFAAGANANESYVFTAILDHSNSLEEFNEFNNFGSEVFDLA